MKSNIIHLGKGFERGRQLALRALLSWQRPLKNVGIDALLKKCHSLLSTKGESSGARLASEILYIYEHCTAAEKLNFFQSLQSEFGPNQDILLKACSDYSAAQNPQTLEGLMRAAETPRQELFRRLNLAVGGTASLVSMRAELLAKLKAYPELQTVDVDFLHLFRSWFNTGFLTLEPINWSSSALVLERLIKYEAVHEIQGWADLKNRLEPQDRYCYAFFHPSLVYEPLIFVEVALSDKTPTSVQKILQDDRDVLSPEEVKTAAFYSISNCQVGLKGISFGSFLIKQVAVDLKTEFPQLENFVTLSPLPGLRAWLESERVRARHNVSNADWKKILETDWSADTGFLQIIEEKLRGAAIVYLTDILQDEDRLRDPVARFHLGNGARIESLQWQADVSPHGLNRSLGIMVNYAYELDKVEANHEAFARNNTVALSPAMKTLLKRQRREAITKGEL